MTSGPPSSWIRAASMARSSHDGRRAVAAGGGARARRRRGGARRAVRGDRAAHPRAPGARPVRRHAVHDGAAGGLVPSGDAARGRAHGGLRRAVLLRAGARSRLPARDGSRATRGATTTRSCASGSRRSDGELGGAYRVLVDANQHVDRAGAERSGVGFIGKNTMLITRDPRVLGRARDAGHRRRARADAGARRRLRELHALHRRMSDRGARRAGSARLDPLPLLLDADRRRDPRRRDGRPRGPRLRLRHLPGRLPVEPRRREAARRCRRPTTRCPWCRSPTGSRARRSGWHASSTGCSSRGTIRAGCGATPSWRSGTAEVEEMPGWRRGTPTIPTPCFGGSRRGRCACSGRSAMTGGEAEAARRDRGAPRGSLAHELRSPVAACPRSPPRPRRCRRAIAVGSSSSRWPPGGTWSASSPTPISPRCDGSRSTSAGWRRRSRGDGRRPVAGRRGRL